MSIVAATDSPTSSGSENTYHSQTHHQQQSHGGAGEPPSATGSQQQQAGEALDNPYGKGYDQPTNLEDEENQQQQQSVRHEVLNEITEHIDTLVHLSQSDDTLREYCMKFQLEHAAANAAYSLEMESYGKKRIAPPAGIMEAHMKGALERMADFCGSASRHVLLRTLELSENASTSKLMGVSTSSMPGASGSLGDLPTTTQNNLHSGGGSQRSSSRSPLDNDFNAMQTDSMPTSSSNNNNANNITEEGNPNIKVIVCGGIEEYNPDSQEGGGGGSNNSQPINNASVTSNTSEQLHHGHFPPSGGSFGGGGGGGGSWARSSSVEDVTEGTLAWIEVGANALHASINGLNLLTRAHGKFDKSMKEHMVLHNSSGSSSSLKILEYVADALAISRDVELHCFAEGYRTMHISLLANLTHDCPEVCKAAGSSSKLLSAVLTCTRLDEENPGCAEWAEYCTRNICLHSPEARDFIKHLKLSVKSPGAALAAASASSSGATPSPHTTHVVSQEEHLRAATQQE